MAYERVTSCAEHTCPTRLLPLSLSLSLSLTLSLTASSCGAECFGLQVILVSTLLLKQTISTSVCFHILAPSSGVGPRCCRIFACSRRSKGALLFSGEHDAHQVVLQVFTFQKADNSISLLAERCLAASAACQLDCRMRLAASELTYFGLIKADPAVKRLTASSGELAGKLSARLADTSRARCMQILQLSRTRLKSGIQF